MNALNLSKFLLIKKIKKNLMILKEIHILK